MSRNVVAWLLWLGWLVAAASACSLLIGFNSEGQPCDGWDECARGFQCVGGRCLRDDRPDDCGGCEASQRCRGGQCVQDVCQNRLCPVGQGCVEEVDGTRCRPVAPPALLHPCAADDGCGPGRLCLVGSVPSAGGAPRTGVCVERCTAAGDCASPGARCQRLGLGLDAGGVELCLPDGAALGCETDEPCRPEGFLCAVFGHASLPPVGLCDAPLDGGQAAGGACGERLCASGLCLPQASAQPACARLCAADPCAGGERCALAELPVPPGGPFRMVPVCQASATHCADCSASAAACGPDAPRCTFYGGRPVCLAGCTPDGGVEPECPFGTHCVVQPAGPRCVPVSGTCP
jgi:hypothetical protein